MFLQAETSFGLNFLNNIPSNESLVFSPLSIALCLSLVHSGAKGKTKDQIGNVLLNGASDDQFVDHFQFISDSLAKGENGVKVNVANKVFVKKYFTINPTFLSTAKKNYNAGAENLDFTSAGASKSVNNWVKQQTDGKIDHLVTPDSIADAVALLVNAVYFKGEWEDDFAGISTVPTDFTLKSGKVVKIPFLTDYGVDRIYGQDEDFEVAVLNYKDRKYRFAVFLPKVKNGLEAALRKLDAGKFQKLLTNAKKTYMNTRIPKFTVEKEFTLKKTLEKMGITEIFTDNADLSGLANNVKISNGNHKALIEINEAGTVASAATSIKAVPMMGRMDKPITFEANHSFLFALVHENHPLFLGVFHGN